MESKQPEALRLAAILGNEFDTYTDTWSAKEAAAELHRLHSENTALQSGYDAARLEIASLQAEVAKYRAALTPSTYAGCVVWVGDYRVVRRVTELEILHCRDMESALNQVAGACIRSLANHWKKQTGETT